MKTLVELFIRIISSIKSFFLFDNFDPLKTFVGLMIRIVSAMEEFGFNLMVLETYR